jgi:hypothetical protein
MSFLLKNPQADNLRAIADVDLFVHAESPTPRNPLALFMNRRDVVVLKSG